MSQRKPKRSLFSRAKEFYHKFDRTTVKHVGRGGVVSGRTSAGGEYKGYRIYKTADGGFVVPTLDPGSVFEDKGQAKRFIGEWTKQGRNPRTMATKKRKRKANSGIGDLIPAKLKRLANGTYKVYVAPGAMAKLRTNPSTYGTSYFTSKSAAIRYYKDYGYDDTATAVARKIKDGEIHIGKPPLKAGQRLTTVDGGKRYAITEG